ncbi:hypothetical protein JXB12_08150 [candidate division KSB1 bacterium]|nr:hypothetical protein [candidate division KSB1 bacterium]
MGKSVNDQDSLPNNVHPDNQNTRNDNVLPDSKEPITIDHLHKRILTLESLYRSEFQKVSESFDDFSNAMNALKSRLPAYVDNKLKLEINALYGKLEEAILQVQTMTTAHDIKTLEQEFQAEIAQIRNDLIEGVRLLGKRVTKAIDTMDQRLDDFKKTIKEEGVSIPSNPGPSAPFGDVKDAELMEDDNYEIIPKQSIEKLIQLFHKQSEAIHHFNDKQLAKIQDYERMMKSREDEYNKKLHRLQDEMRTQTVVNVVLIILFVVLFVVLHFVL